MTEKTWGWTSFWVSMLLVGVLIGLWVLESQRKPEIKMQLTSLTGECPSSTDTSDTNDCGVDTWLKDNWYSLSKRENDEPSKGIEIPTGIFIQSLKFESASEVNLTGYLWQKFSKKIS